MDYLSSPREIDYAEKLEKLCHSPRAIAWERIQNGKYMVQFLKSETPRSLRMLRIHAALSKNDPILYEEVARCHYDVFCHASEIDEDDPEREDLLCQLSMACRISLSRSPYTSDEINSRLPKIFDIFCDKDCDRYLPQILINQVSRRQSAQEDVGFVLWPSAVIMARWIISHKQSFDRRSHVVELGAGCGLSGIVVANVLHPNAVVTLTDFNPVVLDNLRHNVRLNTIPGNEKHATVRVERLDFHNPTALSLEPIDLVIGADIVCDASDAVAVARTLSVLKVPEAVLVSADDKHRFGTNILKHQLEVMGFKVSHRPVSFNESDLASLRLCSGFVESMTFQLFWATSKVEKDVSLNI